MESFIFLYKVPELSQDGSFICVLGISNLHISTIFLLNVGTVPTVWYIFFHFIIGYEKNQLSCNCTLEWNSVVIKDRERDVEVWKNCKVYFKWDWNMSPFDINSVVFHFDDFNYERRSQSFQSHLKYTLQFFQTSTSRSRSFMTTLFHSSVHFFPVLVKGLYQTESHSLHVMQLIRI
jgi:hypothetical protein